MQKGRLAMGETVHMQDEGGGLFGKDIFLPSLCLSLCSPGEKNLKERNKERRRRKTQGGKEW